jgi:hypothetical protein
MRYATDYCRPLVAERKLAVVDGSGPLSDARHVERIGQIPESICKSEWVGWTFFCMTCGQKFWLSGQLGRGAEWDFEQERPGTPAPPAPERRTPWWRRN